MVVEVGPLKPKLQRPETSYIALFICNTTRWRVGLSISEMVSNEGQHNASCTSVKVTVNVEFVDLPTLSPYCRCISLSSKEKFRIVPTLNSSFPCFHHICNYGNVRRMFISIRFKSSAISNK